jgi:DNA polymerase III delta prime subunit
MTDKIRYDDLALYAINTGALYRRHCELGNADLADWIMHVTDVVLKSYRREIDRAPIDTETIVETARELRDHYKRHVEEINACAKSAP